MPTIAETARAFTLPASWYTDVDRFERERRRIFARHWAIVAPGGQLQEPGDYIATTVAGWPVLVVRQKDGGLRGFHNVCRHRASLLVAEGSGSCQVLRCRYHGWLYGADGSLKRTPSFGAVEDFDPADYGLFPIRADEWRGFIFVCLDNAAPSLLDWLGPIHDMSQRYDVESKKYFSTHVFKASINWKTYGDNYLEDYHLPYLHPGLVNAIDMKSLVYRTLETEQMFLIDAQRRESGLTGGLWFYKFPSTMLNLYDWGMSVARVEPKSAGSIEVLNWYLFSDVSPEREASNLESARWSQQIINEDLEVCEGVQRNLAVGMYDRGRLSPDHEAPVHGFQAMVRADSERPDVDLFAVPESPLPTPGVAAQILHANA